MKPLSQASRDFKLRFDKLDKAVANSKRDTLKRAAMAAKDAQNAVIKRDSGGDMRLSGVGKRGAKVGTRFDFRGDLAEVKATGPLHIVANPTSAHRIPRQRARGRKRVLAIPGIGVRAWANHPGTRGKDTWKRGIPGARKAATTVIERRTRDTIKKGFL